MIQELLDLAPSLAIAWLPLLKFLPTALGALGAMNKKKPDGSADGEAQLGAVNSLVGGIGGLTGGAKGGKETLDAVTAGRRDPDSTQYLDETDDALDALDSRRRRPRGMM